MRAEERTIERWRALVGELSTFGSAADRFRDELFELQQGIQWDHFRSGDPIDPADQHLRIVLDSLEALAVIEPDDSSHLWNRAGLLERAGRHLEAAGDFLGAARRFSAEAETESGMTGDESEWAQAALFHAARSFAIGGQPASAAVLLSRLTPQEREELQPLLPGPGSA